MSAIANTVVSWTNLRVYNRLCVLLSKNRLCDQQPHIQTNPSSSKYPTMGSIPEPKRPVRIMNISGSPVDRRAAMSIAAKSDEPIDFLVGDWMSELNMPARAYAIATDKEDAIGYEPSFLEALEPALPALAEKKMLLSSTFPTSLATVQLFRAGPKLPLDVSLES